MAPEKFVKNQIIPLTVEALSNDGNGVGHADGMAIFIAGAVVGDELDVRLVKLCKTYAFGIIEKIRTPSPYRIEPDCPICTACGGCDFRTMTYPAELAAKEAFVRDAMRRIGGIDVPVEPILPSPQQDGYRNKVQYPLTYLPDGCIAAGFYANRSHRVIPCPDCKLQPGPLNAIVRSICDLLQEFNIPIYDETADKGLVRHLYLRHGIHTGEIMVCLVCRSRVFPNKKDFCAALLQRHPEITTVVLNINPQKTNVITGSENIPLYGPGVIHDTLCGVPVTLDPLSFYQVNTLGAEQLYGVAAEYAAQGSVKANDHTGILLDLYCGAGTIGLSMIDRFERLIGVEIIPEAIENACTNAKAMNVSDKARFLCADAGTAALQLAAEGLRPDVIVLDPPRKGCDRAALDAVLSMAPQTVVMISCNPTTAARDVRCLADHGYAVQCVQPVDMFPRTKHVETVVQLFKGEIGSRRGRVEFPPNDIKV